MPSTGEFSRVAPVEPKKVAAPKVKMPPSLPTSQYPWRPPDGELVMSNHVDFSPNWDWKVVAATSTEPDVPLIRTVWARRLPSAGGRAGTVTDCSDPICGEGPSIGDTRTVAGPVWVFFHAA